MKPKKGQTLEIDISKMAFGGQGIGRINGFVIFVKGTMPGDKAKVMLFRKKKGFGEARLIELLEPSPDRINAPCPYSDYCGGCQWQHVRYDDQLRYKKEHVEESFQHVGGLEDVVVNEVIPSDKNFGYRNKMEFSFSDRRWFLPEEMENRESEGDFALGLHIPGTFNKVIDVDECLLVDENGNKILREVKNYAKDSGIPVYGIKTHVGFWRYLAIRHSSAYDEWMVNVVTSEGKLDVIQKLSELLAPKIENLKTLVWNINRKKAAIAVGEDQEVLLGEGLIEDKIGPFKFKISANSFFQTNSLTAEKLYRKVIDVADLHAGDEVLDLYSGTGTIPIFLAKNVRKVTGIELSQSAIQDAEKNCKGNGIENCRFIWGDIREKIKELTLKPDVLIIDPPRAGMHKDVLAQVLSLRAEKVVYVSCNPVTLARDLKLMSGDYNIIEAQPVDMFPQTYHIEVVTKLRLRKRS